MGQYDQKLPEAQLFNLWFIVLSFQLFGAKRFIPFQRS